MVAGMALLGSSERPFVCSPIVREQAKQNCSKLTTLAEPPERGQSL